jgi:hypothetical protein
MIYLLIKFEHFQVPKLSKRKSKHAKKEKTPHEDKKPVSIKTVKIEDSEPPKFCEHINSQVS